jgi:hypothetical protein
MRIIIACCTLVSASLLHVQLAAADGIGGWPLLHWGMTKQQVERAYPYFYNYDHGLGVTAFGLPEYYAAGCTFKLMLAFWDNELYQVYLDSIFDEGTCDGQKVLSILSATYGQPKEEEVNTRQI